MINHPLNPNREMLKSSCTAEKRAGDICQLGDNAGEDLRVIHIDGPDAWVRSVKPKGVCWLVPVDRLRLVERVELAVAA